MFIVLYIVITVVCASTVYYLTITGRGFDGEYEFAVFTSVLAGVFWPVVIPFGAPLYIITRYVNKK